MKLKTYTIAIKNEKIFYHFIIKGITLWSLMPFQIIKDFRPIYGFFDVWSFLLDLFARWRALQPSKIIKNIACMETMWCELCSVQYHLPLFALLSQFCFWFPSLPSSLKEYPGNFVPSWNLVLLSILCLLGGQHTNTWLQILHGFCIFAFKSFRYLNSNSSSKRTISFSFSPLLLLGHK